LRTVGSKIFLTFAVGIVAFGLVAAFAARRVHVLGRDLRFLSEGYLPLTRIAAQLEVKDWVAARAIEAEGMEPQARHAWMTIARAHFPAVVQEKIAEARAVVSRMRALATGPDDQFLSEVAARLDGLDARWAQYDAAAAAIFERVERGGPAASGAALADAAQQLRTMEKALSLDVKLLQVALDAQVADRMHAAERTERRTGALIVVYSLLASAVGLLSALVANRLLKPIQTLTEGVKAVAAGDLGREVEVRSNDELGLLAREFNAMAASLARERAELMRAERLAAVGRISAQITHEIRNPLNAIGLNAELLAEEIAQADVPSTEARALVVAIGREVDRLHGVTEEYLRFARLPKPVFAAEDVNEVVDGLAAFLAPELAAAGVEIHLDLARRLPPVRADEGQLRAALLNLLRNSREAMPGGGRVDVQTRAEGGGVEVVVRDAGAGIAAADLSRIFDPFYSTKEKGTGLGLAFAMQVVKEHGGTIRCDSEVGRGTAFTVRLPAAPEDVVGTPRVEAASA
jgi:signal transduction histidine kinase